MGATSIWHWLILAFIVVLLFGRGKISEIMGDVAKGIKSFKKGMSNDDDDKPDQKPADPKVIDNPPPVSKPGETAAKPAEPVKTETKVG